ncbi:MAG: SipW-dependent-type signal peptide-containing protein [Bacilli bacterium]|nr:SipW-dependent-type signal peptide-containing protein [Bacilli bacterium]
MKKMSNGAKVIVLNIALIMVLAIGLGTSLAYLTSTGSQSKTFAMGEVKADINIEVNSSETIVTTIDLNDLAYVDIANDIATEKSSIFNSLATYYDINITNTGIVSSGLIPIRNKVEILDNDTNNLTPKYIHGLLYLIILDVDSSSVVDYSSIIRAIIVNPAYTSMIPGFSTSNPAHIFQAVQYYNFAQLEEFYEGATRELTTIAGSNTASLRVAFFGDYYNLDSTTGYLNKQFNITISVKAIQSLDDYGGADYEIDN